MGFRADYNVPTVREMHRVLADPYDGRDATKPLPVSHTLADIRIKHGQVMISNFERKMVAIKAGDSLKKVHRFQRCEHILQLRRLIRATDDRVHYLRTRRAEHADAAPASR